MKKYNFAKGSISVFLVIIFVANYLIAALLVDTARVHAAKSAVQSAAELATENILTGYDEVLYDLYGLFAVSDTEGVQARVMEYIDQMVSLGVGEGSTLSTIMAQSVLFDAGLESAWNPYKMDLEVTTGSSVDLADSAVLKSQIIDQMKFRAPIQLADSFLDFLDTVKGLEKVSEEIEEKRKNDEKLQKLMDGLNDTIERDKALKNKVINFCADPVVPISDSTPRSSTPCTFASYFDWLDDAISALKAKTELDMDNKLLTKKKEFGTKMNQIPEHAGSLYNEAQNILGEYESAQTEIQSYIDTVLKPKAESVKNDTSMDQQARENLYKLYSNDITSTEKCLTSVNDYHHNTEVVAEKLAVLKNYEYSYNNSDGSVRMTMDAMDNLMDEIETEAARKATGDYLFDCSEVMEDESFTFRELYYKDNEYTFNAGFFAYCHDALRRCYNAAANMKFATEEKVQEKVDKNEKTFKSDLERLKNIPKGAKYEKGDTVKDSYNKSNASAEMKNALEKIPNLLKSLATDIRDNLYINEYIMTYFRNYVHHYQMYNDKTIGKDGYDKLISEKFCEEPYLSLETTVAEVEYILIGSNNTGLNLAGVYGEIMLWRLVLNVISVFLTPEIINSITEISAATGWFAPLVVLGLVLVTAATQAALDTAAIMEGKEVYVIRSQIDEWGVTIGGDSISANEGSGTEVSAKLKVGYSAYVRLILLLMGEQTKLNRISTLINMNMQKCNSGFKLENAVCSVFADITADIPFLMLSPEILSTSLSRSDKFRFNVSVNSAY